MVIKKYLDLFYRKYAKRFETENLRYDLMGKQLLFIFEKPGEQYSYTVQINKRKRELIREIRNLARNLNKLLKEEDQDLPRVYFDHHLYIPILLQSKKKNKSKEIDKISPAGLVESETKIKFAGFLDKDDKETVTIKQVEQSLGKKNIVLESLILSKTPYKELIKGEIPHSSKDEYINHHVLFLDDEDWPGRLFSNLITSTAQRF